ncbi:CLUMA_CG010759, isoform A [Clunio marinus]|uniref:CLUMA_CG010759, isoform A n=1 Tax=Clunio marinus TaxID=568069 RepID=A0A1J1IAU8_9DIPT|nr:CLUMA_CG010759, isoform A [Clunio marinus]
MIVGQGFNHIENVMQIAQKNRKKRKEKSQKSIGISPIPTFVVLMLCLVPQQGITVNRKKVVKDILECSGEKKRVLRRPNVK